MRFFLLLCMLVFQLSFSGLFAEDNVTEKKVTEEKVRVIFSSHTPPYVFTNGTGILVDIVKGSLAPYGYQVEPVFLPIGRGFQMFADKKIEATTIVKKTSTLKNAYYSDYFVKYHNFAITRKDGPRIDSLDDLRQLDIIAFQNAHLYLGDVFSRTVATNSDYKELENQETQVLMLLTGRIQVAVMDESIFKYYQNKLVKSGRVSANIKVLFNDLFPETQYRTAFVNEQVRDDFNTGLKKLYDSGHYQAIFDSYIKQYFEIKL